jgi:hypothetical protein
MYKNIIYYNSEKSVKKYEKKLLDSNLLKNNYNSKQGKKEIIYKNNEVIISISKNVISFLIFDESNYKLIQKIEALEK